MKSLTNQQIETLVLVGFGIKTDSKFVRIERDMLYSIIAKSYKLGTQRDVMKTEYKHLK